MTARIVRMLAACAVAAGGLTAWTPPLDARLDASSMQNPGLIPERVAGVERFIQRQVDEGRLPGAVLLLARHGQVGPVRAFGKADLEERRPMTTASVFRIASASKIVTSVGLLALYEEGRFALSDPVAAHLPVFGRLQVRHPDGSVRPATRRLTIRDLLRHTTGFGYGNDPAQRGAYQQAGLMPAGRDDDWSHPFTTEEWIARLAAVPLTSEPGTSFEYGFGSDIAGALIERLSGQPLDGFLRDRVFVPLRMRDTGFALTPELQSRLTTLYHAGADRFRVVDDARQSRFSMRPRAWSGGGGWDMAGHGGLLTTAPDFFRLLQMLLNRGELDGTRVLSRATVELMFTNQLATLADAERSPGTGFGFGYGIVTDLARYGEVGAPGLIWWAGSTNTRYWIDPHNRTVGLYFTQVLPFPYLDLMGTVMRMSVQAVE